MRGYPNNLAKLDDSLLSPFPPVLNAETTVWCDAALWEWKHPISVVQARQGNGILDESLVEMVNLKTTQLSGAAGQLRQRAKRLRQTTLVQRVFQLSVVDLRKNWRIIAPNHGKVRWVLRGLDPQCE